MRSLPAIVHSAPLRPSELLAGAPRSLADLLRSAAEGAGGIRIDRAGPDRWVTYAELLEDAERVLGSLRGRGIRRGERVALRLVAAGELLPVLWGCILGGIVPVIAAPGRRVPALDPLLQLHADAERFGKRDRQWTPGRDDDPALVLLTSGSTGEQKLVPLTHTNVLSSVAASAKVNGYTSSDVSLNWLPLSHVGGVLRTIRETYLGCTQVQVATDVVRHDPLRWLDLIDHYRATSSWAPASAFAAVLRRLEDGAEHRAWDFTCVRSLYASGELVVPRTMQAFFERIAPYGMDRHAMHLAWGMTEACFATSSRDYLDRASQSPFADCGEPVPGVSLRILDESGELAADGQVGHLEISGPLVSGVSSGEWLRTGDLGFLREGRLTVSGRVRDLVKVGGATFSNAELEDAAVVEGEIDLAIVCGVLEAGREEVVLFVVVRGGAADEELVHSSRSRLTTSCGVTPRFVIPIAPEDVPRSDVGKVHRQRLCDAFVGGELDRWRRWPWDLRARPEATGVSISERTHALAVSIAGVLSAALGAAIGIDDDFFAMGGSSLQVAETALQLAGIDGAGLCTVSDLFHAPTARLLASRLSTGPRTIAVAPHARVTAREARGARARRRNV